MWGDAIVRCARTITIEENVTDSNCLFCRIAAGEIPSTAVHDDPDTYAFRDIDPKAPTHVLVIPKRHVVSIDDLNAEDSALIAKLFLTARAVARQEGLENGYRLVVNTGPDGGQSVDHLHVHVLGGRHLSWPPG